MKTFTWFPDIDSQHEAEPEVETTKFGDGYEHRVAKGINSQKQKWTLEFDRNRVEAKEILAFLREHNGVTAFRWKTPLEEEGTYICRSWKSKQQKGHILVSCDFEQVFEY